MIAQYRCQAFKYADCWVFQSSFQSAYIGAINLGIGGQYILRYTPTDSEASQIPSYKCRRIHYRD